MEPISATASLIGTAVKLVKFGLEVQQVPETSRVFLRILDQITKDVDHACRLYRQLSGHSPLSGLPVNWAVLAIGATTKELRNFEAFVGTAGDDTSLRHKLAFVLKEKVKDLESKERGLRVAHIRLVTAIGTMHFLHAMATQHGPLNAGHQSSSPLERPIRLRVDQNPPQTQQAPRFLLEGTEQIDPALDLFGVAEEVESLAIDIEYNEEI